MSPQQTVAVAVLTRDLRVHDNPVLSSAAAAADTVVPLFVLDDAILRSGFNRPNRAAFLVDCLRDLDASLTDRGAGLVVRRGDWVAEVVRVVAETGAGVVHVAGDVTRYAGGRVDRLRLPSAAPESSWWCTTRRCSWCRRVTWHRPARTTWRSSRRTSGAGSASPPATWRRRPGPCGCRLGWPVAGCRQPPTLRRGRRRRRSRPAARRRGGAG